MQRLFNSLLAVTLFMALTQAAQALTPSFKANAVSTSKLVKDQGASTYHVDVTSSAYLKAVLPLTNKIHLVDPSNFTLKLGDRTFSPNSWNAGQSAIVGRPATNGLTYYFYNTGNTNPLATINVTWKTNFMTVKATFTQDVFNSTNWGNFTNAAQTKTEKAISKTLDVTFTLDNVSVTRAITMNGTGRRALQVAGGQTHTLLSASIVGEADMTPPWMEITSPSNGITVSNKTPISFKGTAKDKNGVNGMYAEVIRFLSDTTNQCTLLTNAISTNLTHWVVTNIVPEIGTNLVVIHSFDNNNNESRIYATIIYQLTNRMSIVTVGQGTVTVGDSSGTKKAVQLGNRYKITMTPKKGWYLADWAWYTTNSDGICGPVFDYGWSNTFSLCVPGSNTVLKATFIPTPCVSLKGTYSGLAYREYNWLPGYTNYALTDNSTNFGQFYVTITTNGAYTSKWIRRTNNISHSGRIYAQTRYSLPTQLDQQIGDDWRSHTNEFYLDNESTKPKFTLVFDASNPTNFHGYYYEYWYSAMGDGYEPDQYGYVMGYRNRATTTNADVGTYNMVFINDGATSTSNTFGYSFATARITSQATVVTTLYPADGMTGARTVSGYQADDGSFLFFASLYSRKGLMQGWLALTNGSITNYSITNTFVQDSDVPCRVHWAKLTNSSAYYPNGFTNNLTAIGAKYTAPKSYAFDWIPGTIAVGEDATTYNTVGLTLSAGLPKVAANSIGLTLAIAPATGLISGEFKPEGNTAKTGYNALAIDKDIVAGFYKDPAKKVTGWYTIQPANSVGDGDGRIR